MGKVEKYGRLKNVLGTKYIMFREIGLPSLVVK
jgi:hypothetical protein